MEFKTDPDLNISEKDRDRQAAAYTKDFVEKEAKELGEILDVFERIREMPDVQPEHYYPVNRVARRNAAKRDRALKKRDKRG